MHYPITICITTLAISFAEYSSAAPPQGIYGFHYVTEFRHVGRNSHLLPRVPNLPHRVPVRYVYHARENRFSDRARVRPASSDVPRIRGLKIFFNLLETSGLSSILRAPESVTVFAPSDEAFSRLPKDVYQRLMSDVNYQRQVLHHHMTRGRIFTPQIGERRQLTTFYRDEPLIFEHLTTGQRRVDGADVVTSDIEADSNVIHVINSVLLPPSAPFSEQMNESLLASGIVDERPTSRVTLDDHTTLRSSTTTPV